MTQRRPDKRNGDYEQRKNGRLFRLTKLLM